MNYPRNAKNDDFFSSIKLRIVDVLTINCALLFCLSVLICLYVLARAKGYDQITVEKFKGITFYILYGIVILLVYKHRLNDFGFLGIAQENLIKDSQRALVFIFLSLFMMISLALLCNRNFLEFVDKGRIDNSSISFWLFLNGSMSVTIGPIFEEIIFRGFFYPPLRTRFGVYWAIITSSLIFSLWHVGFGFMGMVKVFVCGVIFAYFYEKSRSLVPSILVHSILNLNLQIYLLYELLRVKRNMSLTQVQFDFIMLTSYLILSSVFYFYFRKTRWQSRV